MSETDGFNKLWNVAYEAKYNPTQENLSQLQKVSQQLLKKPRLIFNNQIK
ncbi:hypothetical protein [Croceitalea rosinachiae]|uniref:Uncharacterized protein n=1 Tax=Croceitalea rosinachiae TaxID=3075596 RepID=A0ABU3AE11_9FLAO|nr:hypothetical protein [Croceitalea sp. F388]MDT0608030.1 hypothetical protein [Croceitalea sp. F388]